jgi:hypothetical protein
MLPAMLLVALGIPGTATAAVQEFWDTYGFVEPYGGRRVGGGGGSFDAWNPGVRLGRVGWLAGWQGDLSIERGVERTGDRCEISLDGFLKPAESRHWAVLVLVGLGASRLQDGPAPDDGIFFHYRYGLAGRFRFTERLGIRLDLTALRSQDGGFSSRDATLGWIIYF